MAFASWWYATHGDKKTAGATKPADKKAPATAEKKHGSTSEPAAAVAAGASKVPTQQEKTMKPADTKPTPAPKAEPPKSTQTTKAKSTNTTTSSSVKPSTGKGPTKQDAKLVPGKQTASATRSAGEVGKAVAAASAVAASKPRDVVKEEKKTVSVDKIAAAAAPVKSPLDDALDQLIDTLGGPEDVPKSPKFTGPEIADTPATSEYLEELGKRESSIPPEYRHILDGKGDKSTPPPPKEALKSLSDDDLVAAFSSDFVSSQALPEVKKPRLEEKKDAKSTSAAQTAHTEPGTTKKDAKSTSMSQAAPTEPSSTALSEDALDQLLGTLDSGPPVNVPESPQYTGPEITETITPSYLEELGKRDSTIPPEYRHLLDGKDHGTPIPPAPVVQPQPMSEDDFLDEFSKDFDSSPCPPIQTAPAVGLKDTAQDKEVKPDILVPSSASSVQASGAPSAAMEDALDELMGTLEGPEFNVPESPRFTGPEVTETSTATHIEELGDRDSSIPPEYRHLLDGKVDGKEVPPPPAEKPMSDSELVDEFAKDFTCPQSPPVQQTPPIKQKDASEGKKSERDDLVVSAASSAVQAAPAPSSKKDCKKSEKDGLAVSATSSAVQAAPAPPKAPTVKVDPIEGLASTLQVRQEEPKDKKPAADAVKEKTDKENWEKLGEDEETIPPDYRLKEAKDKDGKPLLPKPEEKPQPMSEDDLLDALTEGFVTSPTTCQSAPLQSSAKAPGKSGSEEIVSCSKASAVQSETPKPPASIPDDALDLLSGSLGAREADPDENKPAVDLVKERAKEEHIDKLGDRDSTIPPEYRHLLDGKDQGKPAKPEPVKPKKPLDDDAAIGALSSDFASCATSTTDKSKDPSKDKAKVSCSAPVSQTPGKTPDSSKPTGQSAAVKPSAQKTSRS
ncbi:calpastatin isoform X2 [Pseudophryne corroboree]|uniref:calpastatin isoform X2 n=1 Tax=Pseudophryne corroboree TaxID=495146 RepID=UPI0030819590